MKMRIPLFLAVMSGFSGLAEQAFASGSMLACNRVAEECRKNTHDGPINAECTRKYDACMNEARCDDAYLSCLELHEDDPAKAERICARTREECAAARSVR